MKKQGHINLLALTALLLSLSAQAGTSARTLEMIVQETVISVLSDPAVQAVIEEAKVSGDQNKTDVEILNSDRPQAAQVAPTPQPSAVPSPLPADAPVASTPEPASKVTKFKRFGVLMDGGIPDLVGGALIYRPWRWMRVFIGGTYNGFSGGIRAGATVVASPVGSGPSITLEAGHVFEGDVAKFIQQISPATSLDSAILRRVSYTYVNGELGLELGWTNGFSMFIHFGASYFRTELQDANLDLQKLVNDPSVHIGNPIIQGIIPSAKIGLVLMLF